MQASFDKQAEKIKKHIERRDKAIIEYNRSSQNQQQQHLLEAAASQEKKTDAKKGFFARLFGNYSKHRIGEHKQSISLQYHCFMK
ncbi:hypothetical protein FO516_29535 [Priestia megaterium]